MKVLISVFVLLFSSLIVRAQSLETYPGPGNITASKIYLVTVTQNSHSKSSFVYVSKAGNAPANFLNTQVGKTFNFTVFSFSGAVKIKVTKLGSNANYATIRPERAGIGKVKCTLSSGNSSVKFTVTKPGKLSVEFNDDTSYVNPLMVFADSMEDKAKVPSKLASNVFLADDSLSLKNIPANKDVIYFAPGVHVIGRFKIPAQISQIYMPGGSFIEGYFYADRKANSKPLTINGRGVLSQAMYPFRYPDTDKNNESSRFWYKAIEVTGGSGHYIEGITLINGTAYYMFFQGSNSVIENVNINGFTYNNDAITLLGNHTTIKNCFIKDNEDAVIFAASNLTVSNCVFWQTGNSIIQLGWRPRSMENNTVFNCDVIHAEWGGPRVENVGFISAMNAIKFDNQQASVIQNFTISDIYFDTPVARFLDIRGERRWGKNSKNSYTAADAPWVYKNFSFKNLHFHSNSVKNSALFELAGFNQSNPMSNFIFSNIFIDGKKLVNENTFNDVLIHQKNAVNLKLKVN
jgi:hypothetical protein